MSYPRNGYINQAPADLFQSPSNLLEGPANINIAFSGTFEAALVSMMPKLFRQIRLNFFLVHFVS